MALGLQKFVTNATIQAVAGLDGTNCAMGVAFSGPVPILGNSISAVQDQSPNNEPRYRVRFYVDLTNLSSQFNSSLQQVRLFNASANLSPAGLSSAEVTVLLVGGAAPLFRFQVADTGLGGFKTVTIAAPTPAGVNRIEFDYNTGTGSACAPSATKGSFCAWVTDGAAASGSDASPVPAAASGTGINPYNLAGNSFDASGTTGWSGVKQANLGIFSPSPGLQASAAATQSLTLDEFDSRRQTFIGQ